MIGTTGIPVEGSVLTAAESNRLRHDWSRDEVAAIYRTPLTELVFRAQSLHRAHFAPDRVQTCQLLSIKTGGCPEDCAYCPQSAHYDAPVERQGLLDPQHVISVARDAAERTADRDPEIGGDHGFRWSAAVRPSRRRFAPSQDDGN